MISPYIEQPINTSNLQNGEKTKLNSEAIFNIYKTFWDNKEGYINQLIFINKKVKEIINLILEESFSPPIIILQADHGPHLQINYEDKIKSASRIFNAYYLPVDCKKSIYDTITPVNTFIIIFNCYFNANMKLLEDRTYYSVLEAPYDFKEITGKFD
ncbi:MAG: hypothetical protein NC925_01925 [Candidatus Omnitrophica bacterium]|nr:hypothetical protein [Candidatus Omnitrophota bacterium]